MKKNLLLSVGVIIFFVFGLTAQVTQINSNKSLEFTYPLSAAKSIYLSRTDRTLWVTDGTLGGTIQLSSTIRFVNTLGSLPSLGGEYIFAGSTTATGSEVYVTDGTPGGTILVKDINPGAPSSNPGILGTTLQGFIYFIAETPAEGDELWRTDGTTAGTTLVKDINPGVSGSSIASDVAYLNNVIYFTAVTAAEGRELWRTDGTAAGTTLVKDIVPGTGDSNYPNNYKLFSTGTYLLFMARTPASGVELWKSDGTTGGTVLLKDINLGPDSSNARSFSLVNNVVLFEATDETHGDELWKTDGTAAGTTILKDINPGAASSTQVLIQLGSLPFNYPIFFGFRIFNNQAYFNAFDGTSEGEMWRTDGTSANTVLVKNIVQTTAVSPNFTIALPGAFNLPNKFLFSVTDPPGRFELWESDGTSAGTKLFKSFSAAVGGSTPIIFPPLILTNGPFSQPLFQGNKFFFRAGRPSDGNELWISDGVDSTVAHTHLVKDINPGTANSDPGNSTSGFSFIYTTTTLFLPASDGTNGTELWKSDGTTAGTTLMKDINPGRDSSNPHIDTFRVNGKILFEATDGDNATETDLYAIDGTFTTLPVSLVDFTVTPKLNDALLQWNTAQELNTKSFTIQRSYDAQHFEYLGIVAAAGTSPNWHAYSFADTGIINSDKNVVYYRLVILDKDGKSANSNVILLKLRGSSQWNVRLLSNPVQNDINVMLSGVTGNIKLSIRDITGKTIYTKSLENINGQISMPGTVLQKGIYILDAETNNERQTIKFVK